MTALERLTRRVVVLVEHDGARGRLDDALGEADVRLGRVPGRLGRGAIDLGACRYERQLQLASMVRMSEGTYREP